MNLGMPEVILILVVALIVFGPRKLPELGKSLGQAMAQFRRASDDFKRSWEQEVELEKTRKLDSSSVESASVEPVAYDYGMTEETATTAEAADTTAGLPAQEPEPAVAGAGSAAEKPRQEHWI